MKLAKKPVIFLLLGAGYAVFDFYLYSAVLSGGTLSVPFITVASGGGTVSTGGTLTISAGSIGQNVSGATLKGGGLTLTGGINAGMAPVDASKGDLSTAHCYPVPFKPSLGHTKITFQNLTGDVEIKIYTIAGELVRTLKKSDTNDYYDWDVRNSRGEPLASGVFIYIMKRPGETKKGKLMVIR